MSVAENPIAERRMPVNPRQQLTIHSAVGGVLVLLALGFVFAFLPMLWTMVWSSVWIRSFGFAENDFLSAALLILIELGVIGGLVAGTYWLSQRFSEPGVRAGIVVAAITILVSMWIGFWIGDVMENQFQDNPALGWAVVLVIMAAIIGGMGYLYLAVPAWTQFLETVEHQGWFHLTSYKGNQGVRVRRGTILGILGVGACGIYVMVTHNVFGSARALPDWSYVLVSSANPITTPFGNDLYWTVPFSGTAMVFPLMLKIHLVGPIVAAALVMWLAWRVVNIPTFADFLIATEAEMNKVSWTSRKRLVQDTIVVLITVFLFTTFLFVVDVIWIKILSAPGIQVLLYDPKQKAQETQKSAEW